MSALLWSHFEDNLTQQQKEQQRKTQINLISYFDSSFVCAANDLFIANIKKWTKTVILKAFSWDGPIKSLILLTFTAVACVYCIPQKDNQCWNFVSTRNRYRPHNIGLIHSLSSHLTNNNNGRSGCHRNVTLYYVTHMHCRWLNTAH